MTMQERSPQEILSDQYDGLSRVHKRIARWILDHPSRTLEISLNELVEATGSSRSTILRFCQVLGMDGFKELKRFLARPMGQAAAAIGEDEVLQWVVRGTEEALHDSFAHLSPEEFARAADLCAQAQRIVWFGSTESGFLAQCAAHKCSMLGIQSQVYWDFRSFMANVRFITDKDVLIAISWGGDGEHIRRPVSQAKAQGVPIVAITATRFSWLEEAADVTLVVGNKYALHDHHKITLRAGQEAMSNALIFKTAQRRGIHWELP